MEYEEAVLILKDDYEAIRVLIMWRMMNAKPSEMNDVSRKLARYLNIQRSIVERKIEMLRDCGIIGRNGDVIGEAYTYCKAVARKEMLRLMPVKPKAPKQPKPKEPEGGENSNE